MKNISRENAMPCHFNFFMLSSKKRSALLISVICRQDLFRRMARRGKKAHRMLLSWVIERLFARPGRTAPQNEADKSGHKARIACGGKIGYTGAANKWANWNLMEAYT